MGQSSQCPLGLLRTQRVQAFSRGECLDGCVWNWSVFAVQVPKIYSLVLSLSVAAETSLAECQQRPIRAVGFLILYPASCSSVSSSEVSLSVKPSYLSLCFLFAALFLHFILFTAAMKSV